MKPLSVVIPSYNYANFLPAAVASVAAQSYNNIELVIIDDKSADNSPALIKELEQQYKDRFSSIVTIFNEHNQGAHAAINKGIAAASGELIAVLNADDLYESQRFSTMTQAMNGARFAFSAIACIDAQGAGIDTPESHVFTSLQERIDGRPFMALAAVAENVAVSTGNMLFEKSLFNELHGFKNYKYVHDYDFFYRAALITEPVFVKDTRYLYRLHGDNTFTKLKKEGLRENRLLWLDFYAAVKAGRVLNGAILAHNNYAELFKNEIAAYGDKKLLLWKIAGTPPAKVGAYLAKRVYGLK